MQDVYIITSMAIVIMVCVWHAIVPSISFRAGVKVADYCDSIMAAVLGFVYIAAHIMFATVITWRVSRITVLMIASRCTAAAICAPPG